MLSISHYSKIRMYKIGDKGTTILYNNQIFVQLFKVFCTQSAKNVENARIQYR